MTPVQISKSALHYTIGKTYTKDGKNFYITAEALLSDNCQNSCFKFSVTGEIYRIIGDRMGKKPIFAGCIHDEIIKHFPHLSPLVALHLSSWEGAPLYAVENGYYFAQKGEFEKMRNLLRLTESEAEIFANAPDKKYFKFLLHSLGIAERWRNEAASAIKFLEDATGKKFINPYSSDEERPHLIYTETEIKEVNNLIAQGYYTPEAIKERKETEQRLKSEAERAKIIAKYEKVKNQAEEEKAICLFVLENGLPTENMIYHPHNKKAVFNWLDYKDKISAQDVERLNSAIINAPQLPKGVIFECKQ